MMTKSLGRRLFSRAAIGAPIALGGNNDHARNALRHVSGGGHVGQEININPVTSNPLTSAIWKALGDRSRAEHETMSVSEARRLLMGGLDPDLAALNSVALQHRVLRQVDRAITQRDESRSIRHRIIRALGGNPEDFS